MQLKSSLEYDLFLFIPQLLSTIMLGDKAQVSLEYLYLTAFVIGLAAIAAILLQDILRIQGQARDDIAVYRDDLIGRVRE